MASASANLHRAKNAKNDECYTRWVDIEREVNSYVSYDPDVFRGKTVLLPCDDPEWSNFTRYFVTNFQRLGLKKLISTSYAPGARTKITLLDIMSSSPEYDVKKQETHGRIFTLTYDDMLDDSSYVNVDNMKWSYLEGTGDFRSKEVTALRDEADVIVTNPPFSLFREFLEWIEDGGKRFLIVGNENAISYKTVFPLIKDNKIWLGCTKPSEFDTPDESVKKLGNVAWFTNIQYGKRHQPLMLDTMANNLRFNNKLVNALVRKCGVDANDLHYPKYDNFDAIEVPFIKAIPSDYKGVMGVPIGFLHSYDPDQFDIVGFWNTGHAGDVIGAAQCEAVSAGKTIVWNGPTVNGKTKYFRILIRARHPHPAGVPCV